MIRIACATDDGETFAKGHFGNAAYFLIYEAEEENGQWQLHARVENIPFEEKRDGDPEKARHVSRILQDFDVVGIIARAIGPNLVRMRRQYVPIISRVDSIAEALERVKISEIMREATKPAGENREVLYIRSREA